MKLARVIQLNKLRVVDLREELEKRCLDKMGNKAVLAGCLAKSFHKESRIAESDDRPTIAVNEIHSKDYDKISLEMVQIVTIDETTIQSSVFNKDVHVE